MWDCSRSMERFPRPCTGWARLIRQSSRRAAETGVPLPSLHSALFAPVYAEAIPTGVTAMTAMALDLLK